MAAGIYHYNGRRKRHLIAAGLIMLAAMLQLGCVRSHDSVRSEMIHDPAELRGALGKTVQVGGVVIDDAFFGPAVVIASDSQRVTVALGRDDSTKNLLYKRITAKGILEIAWNEEILRRVSSAGREPDEDDALLFGTGEKNFSKWPPPDVVYVLRNPKVCVVASD